MTTYDQALGLSLTPFTAAHIDHDAPHAPAGLADGVFADAGVTKIIGDGDNNTLQGGDERDLIRGLGGNDFLIGEGGRDTIVGGGGDDQLVGQDGADILIGGEGADILRPGIGNDTIDGGKGVDWVYYHNPDVDGTTNPDDPAVTVDLSITGPQRTGRGTEVLSNIEIVVGTNGSDHITGNDQDNTLSGWGGSDTISGGGGDDFIIFGYDTTKSEAHGGDGVDTLSVEFVGGVTLDMNVTTVQHGVRGDLTISGFENISASDYNDTVIGTDTKNIIFGYTGDDSLIGGGGSDQLLGDGVWEDPAHRSNWGGIGDDTLMGGDGRDTLEGGGWSDQLYGGKGADVFVYAFTYDSNSRLLDTIHDLGNNDSIDFTHLEANQDVSLTLVKAFDNHPGEVTVSYDAKTDLTHVLLDRNGDGRAEMDIQITGDHSDFTNFVF
jgi:Ca2+-binding RTX toxin-like protein